jgi:hypothetical protein
MATVMETGSQEPLKPKAAHWEEPSRRARERRGFLAGVFGDRVWLVQSKNGEECSVNAPLLFWGDMPGQVAESVDVDRADLFDKDTSRRPIDLDLRPERCWPCAPRGRGHQNDRPGKERIRLHDDTEALSLLFMTYCNDHWAGRFWDSPNLWARRRDDNDDKRRRIVRDDNPDSPSTSRTTLESPVDICLVINPNTSAVVTSTGSFGIRVKNTFRSNPAASTVFGRHRAVRNSR